LSRKGNRVRVLQLLSSTAFHGAEAMAAELVRQLHGLGVENHVALLDNGGRGDGQLLAQTHGCVAHSARLPCNGALDWQTFRALAHYLLEHDIDVVHSHKYKSTFYAAAACRWQNRGLVTTYHNWITTTPALKAYALLDKALARFNDAAIGVSAPVVQTLTRWVPQQRLHQIDNGVDVDRFQPAADRALAQRELGLAAGGPLLGCVGRLSKEKGIDRLLASLAQLPKSLAWRLALVGDGDQQSALQAQAETLGLAGRVHFLGRREDTARYYQAFDLYVLPSYLEAFPMALLEAMACGCPAIASAVGEVPRILDGGACGRLVSNDDASGWPSAIGESLAQLEVLQVQADRARQRVVALYSARAMAQAYRQVYTAVAGRRSAEAG
jgi:glycosyltransferase involved in cell wall biosynthesis